MKKKILFTGGHHNSAIVTIDWLMKHDSGLRFEWVGQWAPRSGADISEYPEYIEVTKRKIPYHSIIAGKLFRFTDYRYLYKVLVNLLLIPIGFLQSFFILAKIRPDLVISFGGYIAVPVVISAWSLKINSVTHEQTVVIGLANRIISRFVSKIYTSWPIEFYTVPAVVRRKMVYTGLPLRDSLLSTSSKYSFMRKLPVVYITGGKKGSMFINWIVLENLKGLSSKFNIIWSCGSQKGNADYSKIQRSISTLAESVQKDILLKEYFFEDDISKVFNSADFVITRGGAHTIYELAVLKKPAIIIPILWSSNNEQHKNGKILEKLGLAVVLDEESLTREDFYNKVIEFSNTLVKGKRIYRKTELDKMVTNQGQEKLGNEIAQILSS